jgi:hypothetical protein
MVKLLSKNINVTITKVIKELNYFNELLNIWKIHKKSWNNPILKTLC